MSLRDLFHRATSIDVAEAARQVALICRSGHRSGAACAAARARRLDAVDVRGGLMAWQRAGLPVTKG